MKKIPLTKGLQLLDDSAYDDGYSDDAIAPGGIEKIKARLKGKNLPKFEKLEPSERRASHQKHKPHRG